MTKITDHSDQAVARLTQQFQGKPKIEGLVRDFVDPVQEQENTLDQMNNFINVFSAIGKQLDLMGAIVGESRRGRNDIQYRLAIIARIAINTSLGTPENAINIFSLLTDATIVSLLEYFPGVVEIYGNTNFEYTYEFLGPDSFAFDGGVDGLGFGDVFDPNIGGVFCGLVFYDVKALFKTMDEILAAGVRIDALGDWEDPPFAFEGDDNALGFGDAFDSTVGGHFANIVIHS